jgi:2-oxoglutarate decarboxylase
MTTTDRNPRVPADGPRPGASRDSRPRSPGPGESTRNTTGAVPGRDTRPVAPASDDASRDGELATPIQGIAARLVANMTESLAVPSATSFREIPVAALRDARERINASIAPRRLSFTHLVAYAVGQAAAAHPGLACYYREIDGRPHRVDPRQINLGLAVDVEGRDGARFLVVPVVHGAAELDFGEFVAAYDDLVARARAGRLMVDDLQGGTVTLTNPGTLGTSASVPRLMAGQGTIVATGAIRRVGGDPVMTVSSTYDHRVIQGAESGRFLRTLDELLQGSDGFYEYVAGFLGVALAPAGGTVAPQVQVAPGAEVALQAQVAPQVQVARQAAPSPDVGARGWAGAPRPSDVEAGMGMSTVPSEAELATVASAMALVRSYRQFGHRAARLDPLGTEPPGDPSLDPATWGLTPDGLAKVPASILRVHVSGAALADVLPELQRTYCGTSAFEVEHIGSHDERTWLRRAIESGDYRNTPPPDVRRRVLDRLTSVEAFELFLQRAYLGQKRFSIEGLDVLVPMLEQLIELASRSGSETVEIGMAHRGRLSVLAHVVGVPFAEILAEFESGQLPAEPEAAGEETSDVKYHRGASGTFHAPGGEIRVAVSPNPSHLEAVDPVVEGRARAEQTDRRRREAPRDTSAAIPVLIHGDAALAGQGIVAETFNLARLRGYTTGGTVHIVANNQLGFTVDPADARSTDYASDVAKGFDVPIVHVNADDPDACLSAVRLAVAYRELFHGDFLIDVVGYRRRGHNEEDEPAYTQPLMYERIGAHPTVRQRYLQRLAAEGIVDEAAAEAAFAEAGRHLADVQESLPKTGRRRSARKTDEASVTGGEAAHAPVVPGVTVESLREIDDRLLEWPADFTVHPKLVRQLERRRESSATPGARIPWAQAEALALGSLLLDGVPVRLTGQDTARGTFSQRHLVLHDARTGATYVPLQHLPGATASCEIHDSPLSEYACLGFEYGYAVQAPEALVVWEAQYGDFANGAEVIIDQFIIAGLAKWGLTSRLTMLLPHGYEGQGPEHSSARIERYLALGAERNIRVANCTTPAQYFHLLRDQALRRTPRPLVLMTPKGLLRLPAATSTLSELAEGGFRDVVDDERHTADRGKVRRVVLCSGRLYYELTSPEATRSAPDTAVVRVELLYPFPVRELRQVLRRYHALETVVWAQEEPRNMGARKFVVPEIAEAVPAGIPIVEVSRPERSSPAEGYHAMHRAAEARIVREALG